jgi:anti-sigma B factor antagonist
LELWRSGAVLRVRDDGFVVAENGLADGVAVVRLVGDLDVSVAFALAEELAGLEDRKPDRLIFDMAAVDYLDCAAAGVLFGVARSVLPGTKPVIRSPGPLVRKLLELAGLDTQCELAG